MTNYKDAGVDIQTGDEASRAAYANAVKTFSARKGKIGAPVEEEGGFAGLLDMGDFFLVQNDDGTGSKMELAVAMNKFDTIGYDLLAMVADDAVCIGAEVVSVSNTVDVPKVDPKMIDQLTAGLSEACREQGIVIPGGEVAEVPGAVNSPVWNATAVGIVAKDRILEPDTVSEGDAVISLKSAVARSNGFSLIRKILSDKFGADWHSQEWRGGETWGEVMLTPSIIYHSAVLKLIGRYGEERPVNVKAIAHITGGGIADNLRRALKKSGLGADLTDLFEPHDALKDLIELGAVPMDEAYKTWNMGNGMMLIVDSTDADKVIEILGSEGIESKKTGEVTEESNIKISA